MPDDDDDERQEDEQRPPRTRLWRELGVTFAASVVLTAALAQVQAHVALLAPYVYIAVAFVFVALPTWVVQRFRKHDPVSAGMRFGGFARGLGWGLGATAVTLVPFAIGFHLWNVQVLGREAAPDAARYWRWEEAVQGRPAALDTEEGRGIWVWSESERLRVWWREAPGLAPLSVELAAEPPGASLVLVAEQGVAAQRPQDAPHALVATAAPGSRLRGLDVAAAPEVERVRLRFARGDEQASVELAQVRLGAAAATPAEGDGEGVLFVERSLFWIFNLLIIQLFFVALPEEYFYRGYVQPTLSGLTGRRATAVVLASVAFALGHVLIDLAPLRLTVFFPSLVFGWLRERSGGLVAPLVYHAACNVMVELTAVHYVVAAG